MSESIEYLKTDLMEALLVWKERPSPEATANLSSILERFIDGRVSQKLKIAMKALNEIANISASSCERYVAIADSIAVEALVKLETQGSQ